MPNWTGTPVASASTTVRLLGSGGDQAAVSIEHASSVTDGQITGLKTNIGRMSNAVPIKTTRSVINAVKITDQNPYDESYSSVSTKLVLQFQNDLLDTREVSIPAPDEQLFGTDGVTAIAPDASATAGTAAEILGTGINTILAVINAGGGTWAYLGGYRSENTRSHRKPKTVRPSIEPTGDPGDAPGEP